MPTPIPIYFNNSSLPSLTCPRRYVLTHAKGLRYARSDSQQLGTAFHHYMKVIDDTDQLSTLIMFPSKQPPARTLKAVAEHHLARLATIALRVHAQLGPAAVREQFFKINTAAKLLSFTLPDTHTLDDTGTLDRADRLRLGMHGEYLVITDYKTTHKNLSSGDFHMGYKLTSQFLFYATALRYAARTNQLPESYAEFKDLLLDNRIAARHVFVNHTDKAAERPEKDQIMILDPVIFSAEQLDEFELLFSQKRDLAVFLHLNPHLARKEGMLVGGCWGCPFQSICVLGNELAENNAIENWPLGRSTYDPTHQNDE